MRVPINIASRPVDTARPLRASALALACLVLILGFVAVRSELRSRNDFRSLVDETSRLESEIQNLKSTQKEMQDWMQTPQVAQIRKRSALLNSLIAQKSLSWTRMFQDLENTLPAGVRITGIAPEPGDRSAPQNQPQLRLGVASPAITPIVDFVKRLEDSPQFENPVVGDQRYPAEGEEKGEIKVTLTARYVQSLHTAPAAPSPAADEDPDAEAAAEPDAPAEAPRAQAPAAARSNGNMLASQRDLSKPGGKR